ncbi:MAG: serine esterase [Verrucomicrobia bacterium]|nr:serine esterase [Verrucomicrobiota bacterium]
MLVTDFIPAQHRGSKRLLVVLHGLGDSLEGWRWLPRELNLPDVNYLLVNAPDDYYGGYSWYDLNGDSGPGIRRSRQALRELLEAQPARGFPPEQTALLGFSQGCLMTIEVGFRFPKRLAALVGISGYIWDSANLMAELSPVAREQALLFTHGTRDPLIPCAQVRAEVEQLQKAGLPITWKEFNKVHTIAGAEELAVIREFLIGRFSLLDPKV